MEKVVLAGGCFWCTEAIFQRLKGVKTVKSGYANGNIDDPSYMKVVMGNTGFAEAVEIEFDSDQISFEQLLEVFYATHDPKSLNKQGADEGPEYRSGIYYTNDKQKDVALKSKQPEYVTEIVPLKNFYEAEAYHQNFYNAYKDTNAYCSIVIDPKLEKLLTKFKKLTLV